MKCSFAIVRFNERTFDSGAVIAVVAGREMAEATIAEIQKLQESRDWVAGWRYFLEQTDLRPGTNPEEATSARQADFDLRESGHSY